MDQAIGLRKIFARKHYISRVRSCQKKIRQAISRGKTQEVPSLLAQLEIMQRNLEATYQS
ncbi:MULTISPECIES: hypothetical protein [Photobacterium]|uniref:Transposase n=1 Tax=Photobacterium ganghwense TaxID=320778 RepID=A0A0J1K4V4_9GAMM|nr:MULTISPECIES: hypothetical protein [Photobacterium]KLV09417.1 hypothetical protein ABT57_11405 [Photobacterium ganghwense]MBV1839452.1 hypothetical protein [Photobacterium ganghwense]PSU08567.1 hypothetical protein C9I92_13775 [Photobacterium ganghwense]QSV15372.1 hypothetical protein FH974_07330 [Photobacterium ganghwense]